MILSEVALPSFLKLMSVVAPPDFGTDSDVLRPNPKSLKAVGELVLGDWLSTLAILGPRSAL
jgi:hypothetical protein